MARRFWLLSCLLVALSIPACAPAPELPAAFAPAAPAAARQSLGPTATPGPAVVAWVNGAPIYRSDFEKGVAQFQEIELNKGHNTDAQAQQVWLAQVEQQVLNGLIDQVIIAQAAQAQGIMVSDETLAARIAEMKQAQTEAEFQEWLALNHFTEADFQETLRTQLIAAELFDRIATNTPTSVEQVHARHILVSNPAEAQDVLARLQAGESFAELAQQHSQDERTRANGGDLGWFPRSIQLVPPQLEEVAFSLGPGDISPVIETVLGYHLVKVELKEADRPLTPEHYQLLQVHTFNSWLAQQRASAHIDRPVN